MRETDQKLQLDSALETRVANSGLQMLSAGHDDPRLCHQGSQMPTNDEALFAARNAYRGPLVLSVWRSEQILKAFETVVEQNLTYGHLTPELGAACLDAYSQSTKSELSLAPEPATETFNLRRPSKAPQAA